MNKMKYNLEGYYNLKTPTTRFILTMIFTFYILFVDYKLFMMYLIGITPIDRKLSVILLFPILLFLYDVITSFREFKSYELNRDNLIEMVRDEDKLSEEEASEYVDTAIEEMRDCNGDLIFYSTIPILILLIELLLIVFIWQVALV